jgi:hypothetical protein
MFTDEEFEELKTLQNKSGKNWHDFIIECARGMYGGKNQHEETELFKFD